VYVPGLPTVSPVTETILRWIVVSRSFHFFWFQVEVSAWNTVEPISEYAAPVSTRACRVKSFSIGRRIAGIECSRVSDRSVSPIQTFPLFVVVWTR
jgi:hypothetical protein